MTGERSFALGFAAARGRTHVAAQRVAYPTHVCRGLYMDDAPRGRCTVLLQSVSGGLFEHDLIEGEVQVAAGAQARVRGAASTVVHEMHGGRARQRTTLRADARSWLEWRPMPLILFPGARLDAAIVVHAAPDATLIVGESFLAHDASGQGRPFGELHTSIELRDPSGRLRALERFRIDGGQWLAGDPAVSGGFAAHGTLWWIGPGDTAERLERLRGCAGGRDDARVGASTLPDGAGVHLRILARDGAALTRTLDAACRVAALPPEVESGPASVPAPSSRPAHGARAVAAQTP